MALLQETRYKLPIQLQVDQGMIKPRECVRRARWKTCFSAIVGVKGKDTDKFPFLLLEHNEVTTTSSMSVSGLTVSLVRG